MPSPCATSWLTSPSGRPVCRTKTLASSGGGDYYALALRRIGRRFARDVIASALEGNTTYHEAFRLLGVRNSTTLAKLSSRELGGREDGSP
jgi:hypothetical protein